MERDLENVRWTGPRRHPHMPVSERAKIFLPFAALQGYGEAIAQKQKTRVEKAELSDDMKDIIAGRLRDLLRLIENGRHPVARAVYFSPSEDAKEGEYLETEGMVGSIDPDGRRIQIVRRTIGFEDLRRLDIEDEDASGTGQPAGDGAGSDR